MQSSIEETKKTGAVEQESPNNTEIKVLLEKVSNIEKQVQNIHRLIIENELIQKAKKQEYHFEPAKTLTELSQITTQPNMVSYASLYLLCSDVLIFYIFYPITNMFEY